MRRNTSFTRLGSRLAPFVVLAGMVLSGGCASQDPVGIRIAVDSGGKGTMTVAALTSPAIASLRPKTSEGVDWAEGVRLTITAGDFDSIDDVSYDDLTVDAADFAGDGGTVRIVMPRGADARWFRSLHIDAASRSATQQAMERAIQKIELHENLTIAVEITGALVSANLVQTVPGVTVTTKRSVATIVIPMGVLENPGSAMVLAINWERSRTNAARP